ncbi:MAG: DUF6339 family protein [Myxococcales bacterium]|nr:DUF6339 family protein [Myxococcales bacterium]
MWSLLPSGRRLITPEFASGQCPRYDEKDCGPLVAPMPRDISLEALDQTVHRALLDYPPADANSDADIAIDIHRSLPLTRREAADPGPFRYLAILRHPELVRHRWEYRSYATMRDRFWRAGTRHDANAFSRWWWIAELTRDGQDYGLTHRAFSRSSLATHLFSRELCSHRPAIEAAVELFADAPASTLEASLKNLGKMLSVRVLEALDKEELLGLMREARDLEQRTV